LPREKPKVMDLIRSCWLEGRLLHMPLPVVVAVRPGSPASHADVRPGDEIVAIDGEIPRDIIDYSILADEANPELSIVRNGKKMRLRIDKEEGVPLGLEVSQAVFDKLRTCDNRCEFCFISQLPRGKGLRRSLYVKDDDYRLSFLYGNFTTLTKFDENDLARVVEQRLSPLFVSIHTTDPVLRAEMLGNRKGATSLRWLRALLDHGIEVHGQIVVCPGINDGQVLEDTLSSILSEYKELQSVGLVPLGISAYSRGKRLRAHTAAEAETVCETVNRWQLLFENEIGRRMVFAADEYYLMARREFPSAESYEGFPQHENGIGMARAFERAFHGDRDAAFGISPGFFASVDGAVPAGYRAPKGRGGVDTGTSTTMQKDLRIEIEEKESTDKTAIVTGMYGAAVLGPLLDELDRDDVILVPVANRFFGGNIAVTGLLCGRDIGSVISDLPRQWRYLLPDVCVTQGKFLDGVAIEELPRTMQVVRTDGMALANALGV